MNKDHDRTRLDHGPQNVAVLRHITLNVLQQDASKGSLRDKLTPAGWDDACLSGLLAMLSRAMQREPFCSTAIALLLFSAKISQISAGSL